MYLLILYFPIINFLFISFFGRYLGSKGCILFSNFNMFFNFVLSLLIFFEIVFLNSTCFFKIFNWFNIGLLYINWGFLFDSITSVMLIVVNMVSFLVHFYTIDYMKQDPFIARFMSYLSLFTFFMIFLVTSDNLLQMFIGWEGVGLVSYLLINFWFTIQEANKSALKAMLMNRLGDIGIALAICLIFFEFKTLEYNVFFPLIFLFKNDFIFFISYFNVITLITIFILIGAIGKSAQFGLHTWLPDAMAGPTPVSALIHAATMVTAGVFVLIRMSPLIEFSSEGLFIISFIGALTAFFAASIGVFQNDLKKIIAYSTCSQLGYMVFSCGLSNYSLSLFHLSNHAFFKALLFLSAGSIIHAMSDEQDLRKYGGLLKLLPFSYTMFLVGSFSLMGIPFLTGFYSKDFIIETAFCSYVLNAGFIYWISILSAFLTSLYSIRLIFFAFITKANGFKFNYENLHDAPFFLAIPLFFLCFFSIFFGFFFKDLFIGLGVDIWSNFLISNSRNLIFLESEFLPFYIKNLPFFFSLIGIFFIFLFNIFFFKFLSFFKQHIKYFLIFFSLYRFFCFKWYIDVLYNKIFVKFFFDLSYSYVKNIDRGLLELFGPIGLVRFFNFLIFKIRNIQTGFIYNYIFFFIFSIIVILFFYFFEFFNFFDIEYFFIFIFLFLLDRNFFYKKKKFNENNWF